MEAQEIEQEEKQPRTIVQAEETPYKITDYYCTKCEHLMPKRLWPLYNCTLCGTYEIREATRQDKDKYRAEQRSIEPMFEDLSKD